MKRNQLVYCPDWSRDNPYQKLLYKSISGIGVPCKGLQGKDFTFEWLFQNRQVVRFIHFHWLFGVYDPTNSGLDWKKARDFLLKILVARMLGYKVFWTVHNFISHEPSHVELEVFVRKNVARLVNKLMVHCNYARDLVHDQWGVNLSRIEVIPHGSYIGYYQNDASLEEARTRLSLSQDDFIFLFFGMVRTYKGLKQLIESFGEVRDINPKAKLVIAGKPLNDAVKADIEAMTEGKGILTFLRFIPDDEVQLFFNAANAVVLPYQNILTSGAALLALSFGKPIIIPSKGCIPELVNNQNGFPYGHDRELTETMLRAARETDLAGLGKKAWQTAEDLDWQLLADKKYKPLLAEGLGNI